MDNQEKYKYAYFLTSAASVGLSFIEDSLSNMMNETTDKAYLRSFYILLSYNFELILKSRVVMIGDFVDKDKMNYDLRKLGHDIEEIKKRLGDVNLSDLGIKEIEKIAKNTRYKIVTTDNKEVFIDNFTKIRYDFLDDIVRNIDNTENKRIEEHIKILTDVILRKAKQKNEEAKSFK